MSVLCGLALRAATNTAADVSLAAVTTAYNACSDGDTLAIPAGTATWSSYLDIEKGISVIGAGTNNTIINRAGQVFRVLPGSDKAVRISGMRLNIGGYYGGGNYPIGVWTSDQSTNTPLTKIRIDHIWMEQGQYAITFTGINAWGVIDHCTFHNCDNGVQFLGGAYVWNYPITPGTTNCTVVEDCTFLCDASAADMNESIMSGHGVRFVVRHNTFDGTAYQGNDYLPYENHGKGGAITASPPMSDDLRGPPIFEIYQNTMRVYSTYRFMHIRGGSCLVWSNAMTQITGNNQGIELDEDDYLGDTSWSGIDQVENSFFWGNTTDGAPSVPYVGGASAPGFITLDRDYFNHPPDDHSGKITWSDWPGSHNAVFTADVAQVYYPYTPLTYPHPLVTAQDGAPESSVGVLYRSALLYGIKLSQ